MTLKTWVSSFSLFLKNTPFWIVDVYYIYGVYRFIRDLLIIIYCVLFVKTVWGSDIRRMEHNWSPWTLFFQFSSHPPQEDLEKYQSTFRNSDQNTTTPKIDIFHKNVRSDIEISFWKLLRF